MSIGKRLREARNKESITAKKLSELTGVPEKTIYRIETEEVADPKLSSIIPLIKALNCSADEILFAPEDFMSLGKLKQSFMKASQLEDHDIDVLSRVINALSVMGHMERQISDQMAAGNYKYTPKNKGLQG